MADTILSGDITVNYLDENRQKMIEWTGSATGTRTANEFYSAMATLLDEAATGDDATAIFADTPVEYTVGVIDANDADPWYVQYDLMEHITGGSFRTAGWDRTTGTDTGIVVVAATNVDMVEGTDVGETMTNASDTGTLLEIIDDGTSFYLVIRPTDNSATHDWDTGSGTITSSGAGANTATQTANAVDGEQVWANYYNVTPIDGDTHAYMYAGDADGAARSRVYSVNSTTQDYWARGAFDVLVPIRDFTTASNPLIDLGYKTIFARRADSLYDSFEVLASTTSGGRNPVPLKASADTNHTTGWQSITLSGGSGTWTIGDEISGDTTDARGIVTIGGSGATPTIHYYPIPHATTGVLTAFNGSEAVTDEDSGATATGSGAVTNQGPALSTWFTSNTAPSITHAATQFDVANEGTAEPYSHTIDCENNPLTEVYEWCQYICQNGATTTASTDGIEGEQYQGPTAYLAYTVNDAGDLAEGDYVTQETSGASGIIVSMDETGATNYITLRDTRGTFATHATTETLTNASTGSIEIDSAAENFAANTGAPFGTFAGGRWFLARGGVLTQWLSADENSWEAIPVDGSTAQSRPIAIQLSVSNLRGTAITDATADLVNMHRLDGSGGAIDKTIYSATGASALAATSVVVDTSIGVDEPSAGRLNIRDESDNNQHYMIRYSSWATSTFTFASFNLVGGATATTNTTQITYATGGFNAGIKRGDLVWNTTRSLHSYVVTVDSDTQVTISPAITGQTNGDAIDFNVMPIDDDTLDDVYPSLISEYALTDTEAVSIVYDAQIFYRVKVSNTRHTTKQRRFVTDGSTSGTDQNTPNIVNTDSIFT
ncbi:MAG: hypothetical protein ACR2QW_09965 [bacterium]